MSERVRGENYSSGQHIVWVTLWHVAGSIALAFCWKYFEYFQHLEHHVAIRPGAISQAPQNQPSFSISRFQVQDNTSIQRGRECHQSNWLSRCFLAVSLPMLRHQFDYLRLHDETYHLSAITHSIDVSPMIQCWSQKLKHHYLVPWIT